MSQERIHLFDDYYFRQAEAEEFTAFFGQNRQRMFEDISHIPIEEYMSGPERQRRKDYDDMVHRLYELRILIMHGHEIIGWHIGRQGQRECGHMSNTGIFKEYRGRGIYSALLPKVLEIFREQGIAKVNSKHHVSNNAVLIPKLKAGFVITGFEVDERYGLFVNLSYIFSEQRMNAYKVRVGAMRPDEEIKKYL
jgi:GNAT superfamily N-acetyltransferase